MKGQALTYSGILSLPDLRRRILFVALAFAVYAVGIHIPIAGVEPGALREFFQSGFLGVISLFTGGALEQFSIFALGVLPYINASIAMQILAYSVPYLEELRKEHGMEGHRKIQRYTHYLSVILAFVQALSILSIFKSQLMPAATYAQLMYVALTVVGGSCFLIWLGHQITERGIGEGISLLIFASILIRLPAYIAQQIQLMRINPGMGSRLAAFLIFLVLMFAAIVYVELAHRKIPIRYARRVGAFTATQMSYLPVKVNLGGVIPLIFAIAFLQFLDPNFFLMASLRNVAPEFVRQVQLLLTGPWQYPLYAGLILFFNHLYSAIIFRPDEIAENLQNQGAYIPGVRPGDQTRDYLARVQEKMTWIGGVYLAIVGILPFLFGNLFNIQALPVSGTGILILVGVGMDLMRQIEAHMVLGQYRGLVA